MSRDQQSLSPCYFYGDGRSRNSFGWKKWRSSKNHSITIRREFKLQGKIKFFLAVRCCQISRTRCGSFVGQTCNPTSFAKLFDIIDRETACFPSLTVVHWRAPGFWLVGARVILAPSQPNAHHHDACIQRPLALANRTLSSKHHWQGHQQ
jgi:hypothetical protein